MTDPRTLDTAADERRAKRRQKLFRINNRRQRLPRMSSVSALSQPLMRMAGR